MTKHQAIDKLVRQAEEMRKHAAKSGLQCFIFHEVKDHKVALDGHYSEDLVVNIAAHIGFNHPSAIQRARMMMMDMAGRQKVEEVEKTTESVVLGLDGKPMTPVEA